MCMGYNKCLIRTDAEGRTGGAKGDPYKLLSDHLFGGIEANYEKCQSSYSSARI
jgi:hypothetical protein